MNHDTAVQRLADADYRIYVDAITGIYRLITPTGAETLTDKAGVIDAARALPPCRLTYHDAVRLAIRALEREITQYKQTTPAHRPVLGVDCRKARAAIAVLRRGGQLAMFEES